VLFTDTGRAWLAAGAPLAPHGQRLLVAQAFHEAARAAGRRVAWFSVDPRFARHAGMRHVPIGAEAWWRADRWPDTLTRVRSLREQLRRARRHGVTIEAMAAELPPDPSIAAAIDELLQRWSSQHHLAPMRFVVDPEPLRPQPGRTVFIARRNGRLVGVLALCKLPGSCAIVSEFVRDPTAPNGTSELLVDAAMRHAAATGHARLTLGLLPLYGELPWLLRAVRGSARGLYGFGGLIAWKRKLRPVRWRAQSLALGPGMGPIGAFLATARAFADRSLLGFAFATALRAPAALLAGLAALLLPWSMLLVTLPTTWFPSLAIQWAWFVFDLLLAGAFVALARRWRQSLGIAFASLTTLDAALTTWQIVAHTWDAAPHVHARIWCLFAMVGPLLASTLLWGGVKRHACLRHPPPFWPERA
jgi:phosphatidylglycerol lysyltransferase